VKRITVKIKRAGGHCQRFTGIFKSTSAAVLAALELFGDDRACSVSAKVVTP
jgi:hypothetical protein